MDTSNIEYRLSKLEEEALPRRVLIAESNLSQLQGEVTAVKEIANGIGVKLDSGIFELKTRQDMQFQELRNENTKNQSFIKGIVWAGGGLVALIQLGPLLAEIVQRLVGSK